MDLMRVSGNPHIYYLVRDRDALRDDMLLGTEIRIVDGSETKKAVLFAKYPYIAITSCGCYTWTEIMLWNRGKRNERH